MKRKLLRAALAVFGLYALYIVLGLILTKTGVVRTWTVAPHTVIAPGNYKEPDTSPADNDGPHVFYADSSVVVRAVVMRGSTATVEVDTFALADKGRIPITCTFSDHPEWNFTTRLKPDSVLRPEPVYFKADTVLAISDIEGNFEAFRALLMGNRVLDSSYRWTFGRGHLVLLGDWFDRGLHVTECLWLIYHMESQAQAAGGYVHFILGNHDLINLGGRYHYVRNKYMENAALMQVGYEHWYTESTELGRWLRSKNVVEHISGVLYVHGGISPEVEQLAFGIQQINEHCRQYYFVNDSARRHSADYTVKTLYSSKTAPFWYRGYVEEETTDDELQRVLSRYAADAVVVGHTVVPHVKNLYDGRVYAIDTRHAEGHSQGVLVVGKTVYKVDQSGRQKKL